ncbi:MAG: hypothetical protein DWH82_07415 [Planctomycetota bacterium]|nr:MAG: hypothetical protein DWH82_07415 [Planctomycetota bacterium]
MQPTHEPVGILHSELVSLACTPVLQTYRQTFPRSFYIPFACLRHTVEALRKTGTAAGTGIS